MALFPVLYYRPNGKPYLVLFMVTKPEGSLFGKHKNQNKNFQVTRGQGHKLSHDVQIPLRSALGDGHKINVDILTVE
jgi:hypothetical protein